MEQEKRYLTSSTCFGLLGHRQESLKVVWKTETCIFFFFFWLNSPKTARTASFLRFPDHTAGHVTFGRTPLEE